MPLKRERSVNFSSNEVNKLINLTLKYKHVIESKKTDSVSWKEKEITWNKLTIDFNCSSGECPRTTKNLKLKYDSLKKKLKKKVAENNAEIYKTGGGPANVQILTPIEETLLSIISLSVTGLPSRNDSDNPGVVQIEFEESLQHENQMQYENQTQDENHMTQEYEIQSDQIENHNEINNKNIDKNKNIRTEAEEDQDINNNTPVTKASKNSDTWAQWNPASLRQRKNNLLNANRNRLQVVQDTSDAYTELMKLKHELIRKQTKLVEKEIKLKDYELKSKIELHAINLKSQELDLKIKEDKLKLQYN